MLEQSAYKVVIGTFEDCVKEVSKDYNLNFKILTKT